MVMNSAPPVIRAPAFYNNGSRYLSTVDQGVNLLNDQFLELGTDQDGVLTLSSSAVAADGEVTGLIEGTSDHLGHAANSIVLSNITDDGDVHILVSKSGNSHTAFLADGSTGDTILNAASGQSVDVYIAGTKEYDFSGSSLDMNSNTLLQIGNAASEWTANTIKVSGGSGVDSAITVENTVTNQNAQFYATGAAAGTAPVGLVISQGNGGGAADNQGYLLDYTGGNAYLRLRSTNTDGVSNGQDADIWRVADSGTEMTLNVDHATGFDFVCEACGRSSGNSFDCHGVQAPWHDDVALMTQATERDVGNMPVEARDRLERLGVLTVDRRPEQLLDGKPQHFMSLNRMPWFLMSGIAQNRWRLDAQYEAMATRIGKLESKVAAL